MAKKRSGGKRKTAKYKGLTIVLPKGATKLTEAHKSKVDAAKGSKSGKSCRGVFFTANKFAVRCEGRSLSTSAKARFLRSGGGTGSRQSREAAAKRACMKKSGKKLIFKSC